MTLLKSPTLQKIKTITNSQYLDWIGLAIVLIGSVSLDYHKTTYDFKWNHIEYTFHLGIVSIINVGFSMIATRLVTKKNNIGNFISTCNTLVSGAIDYLLGNVAAVLTYPVSFFGNYITFRFWKKSKQLRSIDSIFYRNLALGFLLSFCLNYIGFKYLSSTPINWQLYFAIAIPAGITFGGTFNNARMYPDNWFLWQIYNITKLIQNVLQMNWANVMKYSFYFVNAILGYITWNDDKKTTQTPK